MQSRRRLRIAAAHIALRPVANENHALGGDDTAGRPSPRLATRLRAHLRNDKVVEAVGMRFHDFDDTLRATVGSLIQVIRPIGAEGLDRRGPVGSCRLFLGPGFRLGARWDRLVEMVKTRKKREKTGKKRARYGLKNVKEGS